MEKSCVNFIPRNKMYLGIIYDNLKQTWEPRILNVTFLRINLQSMKQTHPKVSSHRVKK